MSRTGRAPTRRGSRATSSQARRTTAGNGGQRAATSADEVSGADDDVVEEVEDTVVDEPAVADEPEVDELDGSAAPVDETEMLQPWPESEWHGPLESITMRPRLFIFPIILLVTIALLIGFVRKPVYTADSQLIVGSVVRDFQTNDGQAQAISDLTDIYSRLVGGTDFMDKVDTAMDQTVPADAFTAAPIPNSALIRIDAKGASQQEALDRADAGADQLIAYVKDLQAKAVENGQATVDAFTKASADAAAANAALETARAQAGTNTASSALIQAEAAAATAALKADTLRSAVQQVTQSSTGGIGLDPFAPAQPLGSDRKSTLQIYGIAGLLIGALLGMALATLSANRWKLLPSSEEPKATT